MFPSLYKIVIMIATATMIAVLFIRTATMIAVLTKNVIFLSLYKTMIMIADLFINTAIIIILLTKMSYFWVFIRTATMIVVLTKMPYVLIWLSSCYMIDLIWFLSSRKRDRIIHDAKLLAIRLTWNGKHAFFRPSDEEQRLDLRKK